MAFGHNGRGVRRCCDGRTGAKQGGKGFVVSIVYLHSQMKPCGDHGSQERNQSPCSHITLKLFRVGVNEYEDGVMLFFSYLFDQLT